MYKRYDAWVKKGVIKRVWSLLLARYASTQLQEDPRWFGNLFIDSTMIKNVQGKDCIGANPTDRGRSGTKLSVVCDTARMPVSAVFSPANQADISIAQETIKKIQCTVRKDNRYKNTVIGDKGYVSAKFAT